MRPVFVSLVVLVGIGGAYIFLAPENIKPYFLKSDFEKFCLACEDTLASRLKSPSSYVRTECAGPYTETATESTYLEYDRSKTKEAMSSYTVRLISEAKLKITTAYLRYEAANSYGALISGIESCEVDHLDGATLSDASRILGPKVSGFDKTGWALESFRRARE